MNTHEDCIRQDLQLRRTVAELLKALVQLRAATVIPGHWKTIKHDAVVEAMIEADIAIEKGENA